MNLFLFLFTFVFGGGALFYDIVCFALVNIQLRIVCFALLRIQCLINCSRFSRPQAAAKKIPLLILYFCLFTTVSGNSIPTEEWIPCAGFQASFLRALRHVMPRGKLILVSVGRNYARLGVHGNVNRKTIRVGARLDVTVDPLLPGCPWNAVIREKKAIWCARDPEFVSDLPIVHWIRLVSRDDDWSQIALPPAVIPSLVDSLDGGLDDVEPAHILDSTGAIPVISPNDSPSWNFVSLRTLSTMISSGCAMLLFPRQRWWLLPVLAGSGTVTILLSYDSGEGPLQSLTDFRDDVTGYVIGFGSRIRNFCIWIIFFLRMVLAGYLLYRCSRFLDYISKWFEPSVANSEIDSNCSPPGDRLADSTVTSNNMPAVAPQRSIPSFATELFGSAPSSECVGVSPSSDLIMDDGGGVFSSALSRSEFRAQVEENITRCPAHLIFPGDGSNKPLSTSPCEEEAVLDLALMGGEAVLQNGAPLITPSTGFWIKICSAHKTHYVTNYLPSRCASADCCNRGFVLTVGEKTAMACPLHFQRVISDLQVPTLPIPKFVGGQSAKRNVSYTGNVDFVSPETGQRGASSLNPFSDVAITSDSVSSEGRSAQTEQLRTLFGSQKRKRHYESHEKKKKDREDKKEEVVC